MTSLEIDRSSKAIETRLKMFCSLRAELEADLAHMMQLSLKEVATKHAELYTNLRKALGKGLPDRAGIISRDPMAMLSRADIYVNLRKLLEEDLAILSALPYEKVSVEHMKAYDKIQEVLKK